MPEHSTLVANVGHLKTNHVSPQFHLIHNDNFKTILNDTPLDHPLSDERLLDIFDTSREVDSEIERVEDGAIVYTLPPLDDIWLDESDRHEKRLEVAKEHAQARDHWLLRLSNLHCLYLLASPLTFLIILLLVLLFWMKTIPCLLPMRARLPLITTLPPSLLMLVVVVSAPGQMRELLLVVRAKAKG